MQSPVYLDASIVVSATVHSERRYPLASQLVADLLASQAHIQISVLTISEALWAMAKLSYCEIYSQPSRATWNPTIFERHSAEIFEQYPTRMNAISNMIQRWTQAGIPIEVIPATPPDFRQVSQAAPSHMQDLALASADATHLATAETQAKSFVTTDEEFQVAAGLPLNIYHVPLS